MDPIHQFVISPIVPISVAGLDLSFTNSSLWMALAVACACRKPEPGLPRRAAADLDLDLGRSWFLGDILDDVEAGHRAGCRAVLVDLGTEPPPPSPLRRPDYVARDTAHALAIVAAVDGLGPAADLAYRPPSWSASPDRGRTPTSTVPEADR